MGFISALTAVFFFSPKGTAMGITCSIQMIGMGVTNIAVGKMLDLIT